MVRQPARRRRRRDDGCLQAVLGRLRRGAGRGGSGSVQSQCATVEAVSNRQLRRSLERRTGLRLRSRNDRIQVFRKDGTFVKEAFVPKTTAAKVPCGMSRSRATRSSATSSWPTVGSESLHSRSRHAAVVTTLGDGGRWPGEFYGVGSIAMDSKGNVYTGENLKASACRSSSTMIMRRDLLIGGLPRGHHRSWRAGHLLDMAGAQDAARSRRRASRSIRCGPSRCRTTGCSAR